MYRFTLAVLLGLFIHQVHAQTLAVEKDAPLTVGALASIHQSAYHVDDKITAVPLLLYDNNRFYLEGTDAGFYPYKDNKHWVRAGISYDRQHYNSKDAKTAALQSLNKRQSSVNAQVSYMYISAIGGIETKLATDILGRSNGQTVSLAHRSKFELLDNKLTVYPKAGITWHSKNIMIIIMEYLIKSHYNQEFTLMMQKLVFHLLLLLVVNTCLQIKLVVLPMCVMTGYPLVKKIVQ